VVYLGNLKGSLPIINSFIYKIPVSVYHHGRDRWFGDKARIIKKNGVLCFEFARTGTTLPIFDRKGNRLFVFTKNGIDYQPMELDLSGGKIQLPEYDMDSWRNMEMRRNEERNRHKKDARDEALKAVGFGIAVFVIIIAISYFMNNVHVPSSSVNCAINGVDLNYCQQIIANQTSAGGVI